MDEFDLLHYEVVIVSYGQDADGIGGRACPDPKRKHLSSNSRIVTDVADVLISSATSVC